MGRTYPDSAAQADRVRIVDSAGDEVDFGAGGGGSDTTAANQVLANTKLDTLHTDLAAMALLVDGIEGKLDTLHTDLGTTLAGYLDGVETALAAIKGYTVVSQKVLTRVSDTNALAAGDAINTATSGAVALAFTGCARANGGGGLITRARITTDQAANVSAYRLDLYSASPTVVIQDNAALTVADADALTYIGSIDLAAVAKYGAGGVPTSQNLDVRMAFKCAGGSTSLFGQLATVTGFTPASAQKFTIELGIVQD